MKKETRSRLMLSLTTGALLLTAACGSNAGQGGAADTVGAKAKAQAEPEEVSFYLLSLPQATFDAIAEKAKAKFPHITLKSVPNTNAGGPSIDNMMITGSVPDIFVTRSAADLAKRDLLFDISELVKTEKFDLSRLNPVSIEHMKNDAGGKLVGIPISASTQAMHFNKDLFDKFGVAYPKDGMTWDDVYEVAKRMTRTEDGVVYRGYVERWMNTFFAQNPYGETYLSLSEDKAAVQTDGWKKVAENFKRFYTMPGLTFDAKTINTEQDWRLFTTGLGAMTVFTSRNFMDWKFNWDVVGTPVYKDKLSAGIPADFLNLYMTNSSKHKKAAFQVAAWLTSEDMQSYLASDFGMFPSVTNEEVRKSFLKNDPLYKGKNVGAFRYNKETPLVPARKPGLANVNASTPFMKEMEKMILESRDVNTTLRAAEEAINKAIAAEKSK
ncbi:extracellular solute-binding protein [Paenibacillus mesophilus]|uniref:ABC transporter substrate-binding protein n=1 Tax=Paenibacillus mesophilus TaxID=2582849 RepID=UPI00110E0053|nr:extracellular solute-binding protein [Paenibacillus mesophilus]TMV45028.1 extracellular solute-binding protein [Paenibacillus mesophilus]